MDMKDIAPGMLLVDNRGKLCVVTTIDMHRPKNPIVYKHGSGRTTYIGPPEFFRASVGTVDLGKFETAMTVGTRPELPANDDASYGLYELPPALKNVKVGDFIKMRHGRTVETVEYIGYNPRAPRRPIRIRMGGKEYRCPLSLIVGDITATPAAKRSEKEIMADIATAYSELSPENLTCDGELPQREVEKRSRELHADLRRLFAELGREVSEEEAYKDEFAERA